MGNETVQRVGLCIGIDATNLRRGGGQTHLIEMLAAADPIAQGIARVVVWGSRTTLEKLNGVPWLEKHSPPLLEGGLIQRSIWQRFFLSVVARETGCDALFIPGGSYAGNFHPVITMSQNMLPFEWKELKRFGLSLTFLKLLFLRRTQSRSFRKADGVMFLTKYANGSVTQITGQLKGKTDIIPHGLNGRFTLPPRVQRSIGNYSPTDPYRILYVSIIDTYKHQWQVVEAVAGLREKNGWPLALDLVGPFNPAALHKLEKSLRKFDPDCQWSRFHGSVSYSDLHSSYSRADMFVFASSCENMPNILLEAMASGLPISCSSRGPMPEVLGDAGAYFDPENSLKIESSIKKLIDSPELRSNLAWKSFEKSKQYSWGKCAGQTFSFLAEIASDSKKIDIGCKR